MAQLPPVLLLTKLATVDWGATRSQWDVRYLTPYQPGGGPPPPTNYNWPLTPDVPPRNIQLRTWIDNRVPLITGGGPPFTQQDWPASPAAARGVDYSISLNLLETIQPAPTPQKYLNFDWPVTPAVAWPHLNRSWIWPTPLQLGFGAGPPNAQRDWPLTPDVQRGVESRTWVLNLLESTLAPPPPPPVTFVLMGQIQM